MLAKSNTAGKGFVINQGGWTGKVQIRTRKKSVTQSSGAVCESRGGRPGLPTLIAYSFCGRKATLQQQSMTVGQACMARLYLL